MIPTFLQVAIGGALGASARYGVNVAALRLLGPAFPYATMFINITGSFVMGVAAVLLGATGSRFAPFVMTGILGGYTTFSAFSLETVALWERSPVLAAVYVSGSVALGLAGLLAGMAVARSFA